MVPIYKHGDKSDPANYRPIALLSHGRQMISGAIGSLIQEQYTFHPTQLGFRPHTGTETAIVRHAANAQDGFVYTAVLDLKSAYDSVPRDLLMKRVRGKLPSTTADMIALELQPMCITTKGDTSGATSKVSIGVPQGGKSSPPLYNVYMDSFAEYMDLANDRNRRAGRLDLEVKVSMLADDVKLQARTRKGLQMGLDVSTQWSADTGGTWKISKCHVLEPENEDVLGEYYLSGGQVGVVKFAEFLGVTLRGSEISCDKNIARIKAAKQRLGMLKAVGINRKHVPSAQLVAVCRTFVYPVADYGIHLMPFEGNEAQLLHKELELLDHSVVEYALGCIEKSPKTWNRRTGRLGGRLPRHLKLAKLPDWLQRIRMRLRSLDRRLKFRARKRGSDEHAKQDPDRFSRMRGNHMSPPDMSKEFVKQSWHALCRGRRRRIPVPDNGLVPILREGDPKVRDAGIKWYTGSFPGMSDDIQTVLGQERYKREKSRIEVGMQLQSWNMSVRKRTVDSLRVLVSARDPDSLGNRGRKRKAWSEVSSGRRIRRRMS